MATPARSLEPNGTNPFRKRFSKVGWYSACLNTLSISGNTAPLLGHEFNHFLVHATTPYGFVVDCLQEWQKDLIISCVYEAHAAGSVPIPVPLYHLSRSGDSTAPVPPSCRTWLRWWSRVHVLADIFEGAATPTVRAATREQAIDLLESYEKFQLAKLQSWIPRIAADFDTGSPPPQIVRADPDSFACPKVGFRGHSALIGAESIMEALADLVEEPARYMQGGGVDARAPLGGEGRFLLSVFLQSIGLPGAKVSDLQTLQRVYSTLLVCLELALHAPVGFPYFWLRTSLMDFGDVHPGYRFLKASRVAGRLGLVGDLQAQQREFQDSLCQELSWPSPTTFEELAPTLAGTEWFYVERHVQGMKHRSATTDPSAAAARDGNLLEMPITLSSGPFLVDTSQGKMVPLFKADRQRVNTLVQRAFLFNWAWAVVWEGSSGVYRSFSPSAVPYGSLFGVTDVELVDRYLKDNPPLCPGNFLFAS